MWQDLKFSSRQLLRHPVSNLIIVLTIALLVGAISTIYASIQAQSRSRMPFPEADQWVKFWRISDTFNSFEYPYHFYRSFKESLESFDSLGALGRSRPMTMTGQGEPYTFSVMKGTASLFAMTEIPPHLGRLFNESDEEPGKGQIVLLTHKVWQERFFEEKEVLGKKIHLNDREYEVVGVLDPRLDHTAFGYTQLWVPLEKPDGNQKNIIEVAVIGRMKGSSSQSENELKAVAKVLEAEHTPTRYEQRIAANGFTGARLAGLNKSLSKQSRESQREAIGVFVFAGAIMGCVILIACFNITNLLLLRATARAREVAIRLSIGASRVRIVRQMLSETLLLSLIGAALALSVSQAIWALFKSQNLAVRFDLGLYALSAVSAVTLGALVGVLPALQSSRTDFTNDLKDGSHASAGRQRHRLRNLLVSAQVGMAIVLCVGSAVMTRSYLNLHKTDLGFDPSRSMTLSARLQQPNYHTAEEARLFVEQGLDNLRAQPGVANVGASFSGLLTYFSFSEELRFRSGTEEKKARSGSWFTTANLPEMVGIQVLRGRGLSPDTAPVQPEILINDMFVSEFLEGIEPLGLNIHIKSLDQWMTVVGVVRDRSPLTSFKNPMPEFYASYRHSNYHSEASFLVETQGDVKAASGPIRETVKRIDRNQPISPPKFLPDLIEERLAGPKSAMIFLTLFASFGIIIAVLGIYGVVSFAVAERTREVGIRMALGAEKGRIQKLLMKQGLRLLAFGGVPGLLIAFMVVQGIPPRILYKLTPWDPVTYLLVIAIVALTGFLACLAPARKASNLNPMTALRHE